MQKWKCKLGSEVLLPADFQDIDSSLSRTAAMMEAEEAQLGLAMAALLGGVKREHTRPLKDCLKRRIKS